MEKIPVISKIVNSMEKVFPETEPANEEYASSMLKNERLNFQLVYKNESEGGSKCNTVEVLGDLAPYITLRAIELMPATMLPTKYTDDYYLKTTVGLYPELLRPFDALGVVLPSNQWRSVWVSLYNEDGLPAGTYETQFVLRDEDGEELSVMQYTVEIIDVAAEKSDLKLTNWMHYDCIANYHHVEPFTDEFYTVFENYVKAYVDCGFNMLLTPLFTPPLDTKIGGERKTSQLVGVKQLADGGYQFDFEPLKKFIRFVMARGVEYIEFSHLFTQWGGKCCPKIMADVNGEEKRIFGWDVASDDERYVRFLQSFLPALMDVVNEMNIQDVCRFHLTDEPHDEHLEHYEKCYKLVKQFIGNVPTMDAMSHYSYFERGAVDIPVPVTNTFQQFQGKGIKELYFYYCCGPTNMYFSNRFLNMPSQRTRVLGYQLYETGVQGFLHWGFNFYNSQHSVTVIDPYRTTSAGDLFPAGDSFIVYPTQDGKVLMSIRAEITKEGFQDYNALKTLEKYVGRETVVDILHEAGITGLITYPRNIKQHAALKQKINQFIKQYAGV